MLLVTRPFGRRSFRIVQCLGVTLAVAAALAAPLNNAPAQAAAGDLLCVFAAQANFTPPLTATNHSARASATLGLVGCMSPNGMYSDLKSATWTASGTATAAPGPNPCSLLLRLVVTGPAIWSPTGEQSTFTGTFNTNLSAGPIKIGVDVTKGVLAGETGPAVPVPIPNLECAINGLTSLTAFPGLIFFN